MPASQYSIGRFTFSIDNLLLGGLLLAAALLGLYARFKGIHLWPLADDEYHTTESVNYILRSGIPEFECGGYYMRGILYQYLLAGSAMLFDVDQTAMFRGITALLNLLCLPPLLYLAFRVGGKYVAVAVAVFFLLSVWEVENARYIRMYVPFQTLFIWYLAHLYRVVVEKRESSYKWIYLLSFISPFVYAGGIFLVVCNFVPALLNQKRINFSRIVPAGLILLLALFYLFQDFRHMGVSNYLPADVEVSKIINQIKIGPLELPRNILLLTIKDSVLWWGLFGLMCLGFISISLFYLKRDDSALIEKICVLMLVGLSLLNQYALILLFAVLCWLTGWLRVSHSSCKDRLPFLIMIAVSLLFWVVYALSTGAAARQLSLPEISLAKLLIEFFKYPNVYEKVFLQWLNPMPYTSLIFVGLLLLGVYINYRRSGCVSTQDRFFLLLLVMLGSLVGAVEQPYHNSRYTFFLYPVIMIMAANGLYLLLTTLLKNNKYLTKSLSGLLIVIILAADDYNITHLSHVDSAEVNFRTIYNKSVTFHLRNRMDFAGPADYINQHAKADDIVITSVRPVHRYIPKLDYYYLAENSPGIIEISACHGSRELWTNAHLLYKRAMLDQVLRNNRDKTIWLILRSGEFAYPGKLELEFATKHKSQRVYTNLDSSIGVYKLQY